MTWKMHATFALTISGILTLLPAYYFPFMTYQFLGTFIEATIWGGVKELYNEGSMFLAVLVFVTSLFVPVLKLVCLLIMTIFSINSVRSFDIMKRFLLFIGRWSMLDVFLLAIFVTVFRSGGLTRAEPELGSLFFAATVIFTLLATELYKLEVEDNGGGFFK